MKKKKEKRDLKKEFKVWIHKRETIEWLQHLSYQIFSFLVAVAMIIGVATYAFSKSYDEKVLTFVDGFTITAHTGAYDTEDNSLDSVKAAIEHKAKVLEIDVRCRPNGTVVIGHDIIVTNTDGVEITTVFDLIKDTKIVMNLDIKETRALKGLHDLIFEYQFQDRVFLTGIEYLQVNNVKEDCPDVAYYLNYSPSRFKIFSEDYQQRVIELMEKTGAIGINCKYVYASRTLSKLLHDNGYKLSVWTVDKSRQIKRALVCKPDNVTTHYPDKITKIIDEWGK